MSKKAKKIVIGTLICADLGGRSEKVKKIVIRTLVILFLISTAIGFIASLAPSVPQ